MSSDPVVGSAIVIMVLGSIAYMIHQRRNGKSCCGCHGCNSCRSCKRMNVTFDENGCDPKH